MAEEKKVVKPKVYTEQEFAKEYQELCERMGFRIVVTPAYLARDDGSWSTMLQHSIGKLPPKKNLTTK